VIRRKRNNFLNQIVYGGGQIVYGGETTTPSGKEPPIDIKAAKDIILEEPLIGEEPKPAKQTIFGMKLWQAGVVGSALLITSIFVIRRLVT